MIEKNDNLKAILPILDGATAEITSLPKKIQDMKKIAADRNEDLEDRLAAYEDIVDSEVGDTTMIRARNIEREVGFRQIYLKFDGGNPTGTQKDRIASSQAKDAMRRGFDSITAATCGNYGVALAMTASLAGLSCFIYIPSNYRTNRVVEMMNYGTDVLYVPGDYENAIDVSPDEAEKREFYDANPGGANTALQLKAYGEIAWEIYDELRDAPSAIAVPVSNGTTIAGIYKGFVSLYRRGKTSKMPKMMAGSSYGKNPIVQSFVKNYPDCQDLDPKIIKETSVNEPLINWHFIDGDYALAAVRDTNGWAFYASDKQMQDYSKLIREKEGLSVLPASTAGLIAMINLHIKNPMPNVRYVALLAGRK